MNKVYKVFLASSSELSDEREAVKNLIHRYQHVFIEYQIEMWEMMSKSFSKNGIQKDTINPILKECDVVILMFHSKVGHFTKEEFDIALQGIKEDNKNPKYLLFYYTDKNSDMYKLDFNDTDVLTEIGKVANLVKQCEEDQHVPIKFHSIEDLKTSVNHELKEIEKKEVQNLTQTTDDSRIQVEEYQDTNIEINLTTHTTLPPKDPKFVDRKDDIKEIVSAIINNQECLVYGINGMGGIGKSAIITEVCYIFKATWEGKIARDYLKGVMEEKPYFKDGILWIKFEKDLSYEKHIENISKTIGKKIDYSQDNNSLKYMFEELFSKMDILIVLDSCEQNIENFKLFYDIFNTSKPVLITSRNKFDFVTYKKDLNTLKEDDARELFKQNAPLAKNEKKIDIICKDVGFLPLAIIIVAKMTDKYGLNETLEKLTDKLVQKENVLQNGEEKFISMEEVFDLSFELLDKNEKEILAISSIFNYPFKTDALKEVTKDDDTSILYKVYNKSLIERSVNENEEYIYSFHPLIREYAKKQFEKLPNKEKYKRAKEIFFLNIAKSNKNALKEYIQEIFVVLKESNDDRVYLNFVQELNWWLKDYGYWTDRKKLLHNAINKSETEYHKNHFRSSLGDQYLRQNRIEDAKKEFNKALEYFAKNDHGGDYLEINYRLNIIENETKNHESSYKLNCKFIRETLYLDNAYWKSSFTKTNYWIARSFRKQSLAKSYLLDSFMYEIKNIEQANAMYSFMDLIRYFIESEEYTTANKIITTVKKHYINYMDSYDLESMLIEIALENGELNSIEHTKIIDKMQKKNLELNIDDSSDDTEFLRGKIELNQKNFEVAKSHFRKISVEEVKNYWLGRCMLEDDDLEQGKEYLLKAREHYQIHKNIFNIAYIDMYLGLIESAVNIKNASNILSHCKKVFEEFCFTPKEYHKVLEQIDGINIDTSDITIEKIDFFLEELPNTLKLKDNKEMILMKKGISFYGKGKQQILTIDNVIDNIDEIFEDKDYYKRYEDNVFLYDFYIDKQCVSNQEYINYCKSAGINIPNYLVDIKEEILNEPITNKKLTIEDAKAYAKFYNKELPLPQEWEKSFRGDSGSIYFKDSTNKNLLNTYDMFELTDKNSFTRDENRYKNASDKYKLIDSFSHKEASKKFIFRCVKPIYSMDDLKGGV